MARILNISLLLIVIVGGGFVWNIRSEHDATYREYVRLTAKVGRLSIGDETKVHVLALPTADPLDFQWQVYLPAHSNGLWKTRSGGGASTASMHSQSARTELVRVKFREIDGRWYVWHKSSNGSATSTLQHSEPLEKPETLEVFQFSEEAMEVAEPSNIITLLKVAGPAEEGHEELIFTVQFGSQDAWAKQLTKGP